MHDDRTRHQQVRRAVLGGVVAVAALGLTGGLLPLASATTLPAPVPGGPSVDGRVQRVLVDDFGASLPRPGGDVLTYVATGDGAIEVPTGALADVPVGSSVRVQTSNGAVVNGVDVLDTTSLGQVDAGLTTVAADAGVSAGSTAHRVLVVVAELPGETPSSLSAAQVAATVNVAVDNYWSTVSSGAVRFAATAYAGTANGHVRTTSSPCSAGAVGGSFDFWRDVADRVGFVEGSGRHLVVYFRSSPQCASIAGLGTLGGAGDGADIAGGGMVWSNGYNSLGVLGHELGHNLGLGHSQELRCGGGTDAALSACTKRTYNDVSDIMGRSWSNSGYLNAVHLQRLGLLPADDAVSVTSTQTLTLAPLASGSGRRVATVSAGGSTYVVEDRAPVGQDRYLGSSFGVPGVTIRRVLDRDGLTASQSALYPSRESLLLDGEPRTSDDLGDPAHYRVVLPVGPVVTLAGGALRVRVNRADDLGASVTIAVGTQLTPVAAPAPLVTSTVRADFRRGGLSRRGQEYRVPMSWAITTRTGGRSTTRRTDFLATISRSSWRSSAYRVPASSAASSALRSGRVSLRLTGRSSLRYRGAWHTARVPGAIGGSEAQSTRHGAALQVTVTARSVALVARTAPRRGTLAVYVDGRYLGRIVLSGHAARTAVVWSRDFGSVGRHVVRFVSRSRGRIVAVDAIVVAR